MNPNPTLQQRLDDAVRGEQPLRARVAELEAQLASAVAEQDFETAATAKRDLGPAREALAVAEATTVSLRTAQAQIEQKRRDEDAEVQRAQRAADARRRIDAANEQERDALADLQARHTAVREHIAAVRRELGQAFAADMAITEARQAVYAAQVELGEREPSMYMPAHQATQSLIDNHPTLTALIRGDFK